MLILVKGTIWSRVLTRMMMRMMMMMKMKMIIRRRNSLRRRLVGKLLRRKRITQIISRRSKSANSNDL